MSKFVAFMEGLDPKTAARKTAAETEIVRYPLASRRLTHSLGGGIAAGRICTIYGNYSGGKSLLSMQTVGMMQKQGLVCGLLDAEGTYDKEFGNKLGVNNDELLISRSKPFLRATEDILPWVNKGMDLLVIDTISDLIPEDFMDDKNEHFVPEKAKKMMAHAKSTANLIRAIMTENDDCAVIFLSQTTTKVNQQLGYAEQVPHGGERVGFDSSQIIRLTSSPGDSNQITGTLQFGQNLLEKPIGRKVDWFTKKNKLGRSHDKGSYNMYYAGPKIGVDRDQELIAMGGDFGVFDMSSKGWIKYRGESFREKDLVKMIQKEEGFEKEVETELELAMAGGVLDE